MRIVCISDTHTLHRSLDVPDGDLLIHAGDLSSRGRVHELEGFFDWLEEQPHRHKVFIAGNHDFLFQKDPRKARSLVRGATYLYDSLVMIEGLRIWGSPWQPWFYDWAFNLQRGAEIKTVWDKIPLDTDVLVTHGPPYGIRDLCDSGHVGCEELAIAVARVKPRLHIFGHIHEGYGKEYRDGTLFLNASSCDLAYRPVNPPLVIDV